MNFSTHFSKKVLWRAKKITQNLSVSDARLPFEIAKYDRTSATLKTEIHVFAVSLSSRIRLSQFTHNLESLRPFTSIFGLRNRRKRKPLKVARNRFIIQVYWVFDSLTPSLNKYPSLSIQKLEQSTAHFQPCQHLLCLFQITVGLSKEPNQICRSLSYVPKKLCLDLFHSLKG